ncbi:MAPEG family protein [Alloalcanivorax xenomutans]|jgi:uncharacterized protein|uniref:MAPEG family protein n=1 Tax=Alloalcanivorax xenomutans TaxID=1094342 RepID=UPI0003B923F7|nr:MAPEG family protein [Alloalcanivorax xenomutans]ERS10654.1 hypothetical protein Q668_03460 [Alcanivorax sp. PN-3]MBA4720927.1 MAPEG family protein [Alcanivorax sp.]MCE7524354.1 MAPEG family protein [Alloalcanivorax xenomutans]PHS70512.1 MAG: hypothetical protein COB00_04510 [Alcanivorax sp.]CUR45961.1 probable membrane protein STY2112 [Alloalcanivorax xenomutans]
MSLTITALYTGLFILLLLALAANVVRNRLSGHVSLGDGGNPSLQKAVRAHGNATEYVPIVLIGLAVLENLGTSATLLHLYGSGLFVGRLLHAWGLARPSTVNLGRQSGIVITWVVMLTMGLQLIWRSLVH